MAFVFDLNFRFYKMVPASSSETLDYTPPNGEKVLFVNVGISSSAIPDTVGSVIWDPDGDSETIISSYGEVVHENIGITRIGDGIKKIQIILTNDLTEPTHLGAFWQAEKI